MNKPPRWLLVLSLVLCPSGGRAQEPAFDQESYYRAIDYCHGNVARPLALSPDQRILCFDGWIEKDMDISLGRDLKDSGIFVVRSNGGSVISAIALSEVLSERHATVVIYDYCVSACASYFFVASNQTYVVKDTLVAWHNMQSGLPDCASLENVADAGPKKLGRTPCPDVPFDYQAEYRKALSAEARFYLKRAFDPRFSGTPESVHVRRILKNLYEEKGVYPNVLWTWNPRHHQSTLKTKIYYEAYPESQAEVDGMLARLGWKFRVIYDP